jgi:integrase
MEHWLETIHKPAVKPRTWQTNVSTVRNNITPHIGAVRLDELTAAHVRHMHKAIVGAGRSTQTAHNAHTILSTALTSAEREGMVPRNVAKLTDKPHVEAEQRDPLIVEQARRLLQHCKEVDDPMLARWAFALQIGSRRGECLGLTWDRVDFVNGTADISFQLQQLPQKHGCGDKKANGWPCGKVPARACNNPLIDAEPGFKYKRLKGALSLVAPKSKKSIRIVPLPTSMLAMLADHKAKSATNEHNLVWTNKDGNPINPRADTEAWATALKAAGLPHAPLHAARHTTATLLAELKVEEHVRMQIMGHSSAATARGYTHVDTSLARSALSKYEAMLALEPVDAEVVDIT